MTTKRTTLTLATVLTALLWGAAVTLTHAGEADKKANISAPEAILKAFHKTYPAAKILNVSKESKDGQIYYEIESLDGTVRRDLLYLSDGAVFEIEEAIALGDLPVKVTDSLKAMYPDGKIQKAERITRGSVVEYEVLLENGEDNLEVLLGSNGTIKSQVSISDEDEKAENSEGGEADED
jgi:hypothetical protein